MPRVKRGVTARRRHKQIIKLASEFLVILRRQRELGQIPDADVAAQEAALAQVEQTLPPLQRQLEQQRRAFHKPSSSCCSKAWRCATVTFGWSRAATRGRRPIHTPIGTISNVPSATVARTRARVKTRDSPRIVH